MGNLIEPVFGGDRADLYRFKKDVVSGVASHLMSLSLLAQEFRETKEGVSVRMPSKMDAVREISRQLGFYRPQETNLAPSGGLLDLIRELHGG